MKLLELFTKLDEMPLGRFDPSGVGVNPEQYSPADTKLLTSPNYEAKLSRALSKSPMTINVLTVAIPKAKWEDPEASMDMLDLYGTVDDYKFQELMRSRGVQLPDLETTEGVINILILSNTPGQFNHPITPWMMAHKIAHVVMEETGLRGAINNAINIAWEDATGDYLDVGTLDDDKDEVFAKMLPMFTMRSARTGNMNHSEVVIELMTQYLINGRITLTDVAPPGLEEELNELAKVFWSRSSGSYWTT